MERQELAAWLGLLESPGIDLGSARRLLRAFGSPQAVFQAPASAWREHLSAQQAAALASGEDGLPARIERSWQWLQADPVHQMIVLGDPDYPAALLATSDPPLLLYAVGRRDLLERPMLAMVGSRNPSPQGRDNALAFSRALSQAGLCIVSGLALGIDGAAHEGALAGGGGTIAVLGSGIDQIYPPRHARLAQTIAAEGLLLSEYPLGTPPLGANFPRRNRIIAGLASGCLVVEAALHSGSLITARLACEAGREVFAIPGSIHSPLSRGCHALIRQGAKLVETTRDVLEELALPLSPSLQTQELEPAREPGSEGAPWGDASGPDPGSNADARRLLASMGLDPVTLEVLLGRGGWNLGRLQALLLDLELDGHISRLPGPLFQRRGRG